MIARTASAEWNGGLKTGHGSLRSESGAIRTRYSYPSRFEHGPGSNPEELLAASHASCYAMALSALLENEGFSPESVAANAEAVLEEIDGRPTITRMKVDALARMPSIDPETFDRVAADAKTFCPVSRALAGVELEVTASLADA